MKDKVTEPHSVHPGVGARKQDRRWKRWRRWWRRMLRGEARRAA